MQPAGAAHNFTQQMKVLFFVQIRSFTGCEQTEMEVAQPIDGRQLWTTLDEKFPGISKFRSSTRLARNSVYARNDESFSNNDEVALLSPVSGG